jgi:hypothetical protein
LSDALHAPKITPSYWKLVDRVPDYEMTVKGRK